MKQIDIKRLTKEEYKHLDRCLSPRGVRSDYAKSIGKHPSYVTRMLGKFKVYDIPSMSYVEVYGIYEREYDILNQYIKTL